MPVLHPFSNSGQSMPCVGWALPTLCHREGTADLQRGWGSWMGMQGEPGWLLRRVWVSRWGGSTPATPLCCSAPQLCTQGVMAATEALLCLCFVLLGLRRNSYFLLN